MDALQVVSGRYNASAHFAFVTPTGNDLNSTQLLGAVLEADRVKPWVTYYTDGRQAPSIYWYSEPTMREGEWIDRRYELEIRPFALLTCGQLLAYERYAQSLAELLVNRRFTGILSIHVSVVFKGVDAVFRPA